MNAYESRYKEKRFVQRERAKEIAQMRTLEIMNALKAYEDAYFAANGKHVYLQYHNGWVHGSCISAPYRLKQIVAMTETLKARVHERELNTPVENG